MARAICPTQLPEVVAAVADQSLPASTRFVIARLAEALDPTSPISRRAVSHCDPRALVRDLTAAIAAYTPNDSHSWGLLTARLARVRTVIQFDMVFRRSFPAETSALLAAVAQLPSNPGASDWPAVETQIRIASVDLRKALTSDGGYRRRLTMVVADACQGRVIQQASLRRLDERVGLLALMLLDEGQDAVTVSRRFASAVHEARPLDRYRAAEQALYARPRSYEVLVATQGLKPRPTPNAALRIHALRALVTDIRRWWPTMALVRFTVASRALGANGVVSVRLKARDAHQAVRLARSSARGVCAHQGGAALPRRPRTLGASLVRRAGSAQTELVTAPAWYRSIKAAPPHGLTSADRALAYAYRAAVAESDVARVLDSWIAIEALVHGRGGVPGRLVAREIPDLLWIMAVRSMFLWPLEEVLEGTSTDVGVLASFVAIEQDRFGRRWLDVLDESATPQVLDAFERIMAEAHPLLRHKLSEARVFTRHGKLMALRADRHREQCAWLIGRLRESRNAVAHSADGDPGYVSPQRALDSSRREPVDVRVLGAFGVAVLDTFGKIAATRLVPGTGNPGSPERLLANARTMHQRIHRRLVGVPRGARAIAEPPSVP